MEQYEIRINGRVQGIGFRYYAKMQAEILELKGWVKNLPDGSVLIVVQGDETNVDTFADYIKIGPGRSHITSFQKVKIHSETRFEEFSIQY